MSYICRLLKTVKIYKGSGIIGSRESHATGNNNFVAGSVRGRADGTAQSSALSSYNTINPNSDSIAMGWAAGSTPSSVNRKIELLARNGTINPFQDYCEYFESLTGEKIPAGTLVALRRR
ncbi:peptidase G2 autoproteolytic cleavage domain-containing protein [Bacillus sonorensis]|uniref:peptidase G2 autoproteolytic cleavage domain-containing protein n=1 Tax=Bacillus sonorensis TaxID=119858 RepID=UPI0022815594